jgi:hypothetical protein
VTRKVLETPVSGAGNGFNDDDKKFGSLVRPSDSNCFHIFVQLPLPRSNKEYRVWTGFRFHCEAESSPWLTALKRSSPIEGL